MCEAAADRCAGRAPPARHDRRWQALPMIRPLRGRWSSRTDGNGWSLAVKVGLLNIGLCAALAFVLTGLATYRGFTGLERQAEIALAADAGIVADGVDNWHALRVA